MTRKDYIEIANILNDYKNRNTRGNLYQLNEDAYNLMILDFCAMLKLDNRNFDTQRFIDAVNKSN
tara:strand:- start:269 stop:463 length:195 start_codon:yes stop_codon:yes gene_type:complete